MWNDEIVEETRRLRNEYAARFNYDLVVIYNDLKALETRAEHKTVSLPPKKPVSLPPNKSR